MKTIQRVVLAFILANAVPAFANDFPVCRFLPKSPSPDWIDSGSKDADYYYAVGGASGVEKGEPLDINEFISAARKDAIANLASSIRSSIKISTKRSIESKKAGKSKAEVRKEASHKAELISQVTLASVTDDAKWLDRENCLLWYRVKVSRKGAEVAVQAYVDEVAEQLNQKIEDLTSREIEQILSDNGFLPTASSATRALTNDSVAVYRGTELSVAELFNQSGFDWVHTLSIDEAFRINNNSVFYGAGALNQPYLSWPITALNTPSQLILSDSSSDKVYQALKKLDSYGIELNKVRIKVGEDTSKKELFFAPNKKYNQGVPGILSLDIVGQQLTKTISINTPVNIPLVHNFKKQKKWEEYGLLHLAVVQGRKDLLAALAKVGIDINQRSVHGYTALALAIEFGRIDMAQELIKLGADTRAEQDLAYKVGYLILHLTKKADTNPASFPVGELPAVLKQLKTSSKKRKEIESNIIKKYPIETEIKGYDSKANKVINERYVNGVKV
ncbi:MAG: ankyrin repeat domain-containing protein [Vibrionaceae bacterium]|nr:ankyrin repeat domain-containing protein [Vibrionaceae bacterium]